MVWTGIRYGAHGARRHRRLRQYLALPGEDLQRAHERRDRWTGCSRGEGAAHPTPERWGLLRLALGAQTLTSIR